MVAMTSSFLWGTSSADVSRRRTAFFALSTVVLLFSARSGASESLFWVALALFGSAATVWVRGQYTRSLVEDRAGERWWGYLIVLGVAAALLAAYVVLGAVDHTISGLLLGAIAVGYFGVGGLIEVWRRSRESRLLRDGLALGVAAVMCAGGGYLVLTNADTGGLKFGALLLVAGLFACWPTSVALLSELATSRFARDDAGKWLWIAMGTGLLGYASLVVFISVQSQSVPILIALLALGVLIVSVASNTRADIVLVIAVLAVMGFSPGDATPPTVRVDGSRPVLVALGDSYMSGEGASIFYRGTDTAGQDTCRRAPTAWAALAGRQPPFGGGTMFLACSGAVTANVRASTPAGSGLDEPRVQAGEGATQLEQVRAELAANPDVDVTMVVLSLGGNDAGFSTIGTMCLVNGDCATKDFWWTQGLKEVGRSLSVTYDQVRDTFPDTPVVVTAYPDPIYQSTSASGATTRVRPCHQVALRADEQTFIESFVDQLDQTVRAQAEAHGFYYLDVMQSSLHDAGLQLCDPLNNGRPGLNFIGLRSVDGLAEQRFNPANWAHNSLHPNERGHQAMLQTFETWYAENAPLQAQAPVDQKGAEASGTAPATLLRPTSDAVVAPVCSPLDPTPAGCRSRGTHWAVSNVAAGLVTGRAGLMVLAYLLLWVGVLAFFGWRRRRWHDTTQKANLI